MGRWSEPSAAWTVHSAKGRYASLIRVISGDEEALAVTRVDEWSFRTARRDSSISEASVVPREPWVPAECQR